MSANTINLDDLILAATEAEADKKPKPKPQRRRRKRTFDILPNSVVDKSELMRALEDSPSALSRDWLENLARLLDQLIALPDGLERHAGLILSLIEKAMLARASLIIGRLPNTTTRLEYLMRLAVNQGDLALAARVIRMAEELRITTNPDEPASPALMAALDRIASIQEAGVENGPPHPGHAEDLSRMLAKAQGLIREAAEAEAE